MKLKAQDELINELISLIESGVKPWRCPWSKDDAFPTNYLTKKPYSGVNIFSLWMYGSLCEYSTNSWLTFKQAQSLGFKVKKGSKSAPVFFYKSYEVEDPESEDGEKVTRKVLKSFRVFNIDQLEDEDGNPVPIDLVGVDSSPVAGELLAEMEKLKVDYSKSSGVRFVTSGGQAFYSPREDKINMPDFNLFESEDGYSSTLLHEIIHSTGANNRLNRFDKQTKKYGNKDGYAVEELIADIGACLLGSQFGVTGEVENHASYLSSWLKQLKNDKSLFFTAASEAQKACDYFFQLLDSKNKKAA